MPEILLVAAACCAVMTGVLVRMLRPARRAETVIRALATAAAAAATTVGVGVATGADTASYLLSSACATAPVSVLLSAAVEASSPARRGAAWALSLVWGVVVFPLCTIVPPLVFRMCGASECRVQDFGGGLAVIVSAAATVLLAVRAPSPAAHEGWTRFALPVAVIWGATAVWLVSLEGVIDAYTPRILSAAVLAPAGGAVAWTLVDLLRRADRHPAHSAAAGVLAGIVAIFPGAASISFPWTLAVGALAGAAAAVMYGWRRLARLGATTHWALVVLTATAIGYLAPAVSGDSIGFLFSGRITALVPPLVALVAVVALGVLATVPIWATAARGRSRP